MKKSYLVFAILLLMTPLKGYSALVNYAIHQDYVSARALGMGNAFTAVADDYSTLFYNPAGLGKLKKGEVNMFLEAGLSPSVLDLISDVGNISGNTSTEKANSASAVIDKYSGKNFYARPSLGGIWTRPNWGIAVIPFDLEFNMSIHDSLGPTLNIEANQATTIAYGYGREVKWSAKDKWYWGATAKAVYRGYYSDNVAAADLAISNELFKKDKAKEGLGIDLDLGLLYEPQFESGLLSTLAPTFSFVIRNLADLGYKQNMHLLNQGSTEPPKSERRFDIGSKWQLPQFWKIFTVRAMVDLKDMGHSKWNYMKGLHIGAEFDWNIASWWRGGWRVGVNQGYLTAGFTGKFLAFMLDLTTWGEEVGTIDSRQENRRYMFTASIDF